MCRGEAGVCNEFVFIRLMVSVDVVAHSPNCLVPLLFSFIGVVSVYGSPLKALSQPTLRFIVPLGLKPLVNTASPLHTQLAAPINNMDLVTVEE